MLDFLEAQLRCDSINALSGALFRKVLSVHPTALAAQKSGKVMNLLSQDSNQIMVSTKFVHGIPSCMLRER